LDHEPCAILAPFQANKLVLGICAGIIHTHHPCGSFAVIGKNNVNKPILKHIIGCMTSLETSYLLDSPSYENMKFSFYYQFYALITSILVQSSLVQRGNSGCFLLLVRFNIHLLILTLSLAKIQTAALIIPYANALMASVYPCSIFHYLLIGLTGRFYETNPTVEGGCNPPWGIVAASEDGIKAYECNLVIISN
jgi:hypothetical protein